MNRFEREWSLFSRQVNNTKLISWLNANATKNFHYIIIVTIGLIIIVGTGLIANRQPFVFVSIWLFIPLVLVFFILLKLQLNKKLRKVLLAVVIIQSVGIYFSRDDVMDYIGERYVAGYVFK